MTTTPKGNRFQPLMEEVIELNNKMKAQLVAYLKEHGRFVRTDALCTEDRLPLPTMWAILMQNDFSQNHEYPVMAVALSEQDDLMILVDATEGFQNLGDMTEEEIRACEDWYNFEDGYVTINATLYNILDTIENYVREKEKHQHDE